MSAPTSDKAGIRQTIRALRKAGHTITAVNNARQRHRRQRHPDPDLHLSE
jgi:hypothetical protein